MSNRETDLAQGLIETWSTTKPGLLEVEAKGESKFRRHTLRPRGGGGGGEHSKRGRGPLEKRGLPEDQGA